MITEVSTKTVKCYNYSTLWQYTDEDVKESTTYDPRYGELKNKFIRCPKCNDVLEVY